MEGSKNKVLKSDQNKIGGLPDSVLHQILSFLDMKEVVGTSLVSTRWRYIWALIPVLNFNHNMWTKVCTDNDKPRKQGFMNFVDKVLFLRDGSRVSRLRIFCSNFCDSDRVAAWLTVAARRQFQEIQLAFCSDKQMKLPHLLFTSEIKLFNLQVIGQATLRACLTEVPNSVSLSPHLRSLRLDLVSLPKGNSDGELMLSCPVLENLALINCNQRHLNVLIISIPQLKNLTLMNYTCDLVGSCQIKIWTPNLLLFFCIGFWYSNCSLMNYSSLHVAHILIKQQSVPHYLVKLLEAVSCAKRIELSVAGYRYTLTKLTHTQFLNLRHLKLKTWGSKKLSIRAVLDLLKNAPIINTLSLDAPKLDDYDEEVVPFKCYHLKDVEIRGIEGFDCEVKFLNFLLKNAVVLEKLMIIMWVDSSICARECLWRRINSLGGASTGLTVVIV